ncbi:hypothetical protein BGZ58_001490 [Dissophora ornata]|nr:hypothetical protein BGZ58_001490 [Dissophora ornata]
MPIDIPCPYNTPVVSGAIQVYSSSGPPSITVGRLKDKSLVNEKGANNTRDLSYEELLKAVDSLNVTVEMLSRKIVTMMNMPNTAPSQQRRGSLRDEGFSSGISNLNSPAGLPPTPATINPLSAWAVRSSLSNSPTISLSNSPTISLSHFSASGSQQPSGTDITLVIQPPPTWHAENSSEAAVLGDKLNSIERNNNHSTARPSTDSPARASRRIRHRLQL